MKLSERAAGIQASGTVRFTALLAELRAKGRDIVDLAVGEPAGAVPEKIIAATCDALDQQKTRYSTVAGIDGLRRQLADRFAGRTPADVILTNGSKQALYMAFQVVCNPGDEVVIPTPCWVSFAQQVRLAGGRPVFVPTDRHQLDCNAIKRALTRKTRAVVINSPNNPTGAVYPEKDIAKIVRLVLDRDLYLIADEAYEYFVYDGIRFASPADIRAVRDRLILVRSFSKSFSMTGFRTGYAVAPAAIIKAMTTFQGHLSGNVCTFAQYGALAAADLGEDYLQRLTQEYTRKRDIAFDMARELFDCIRPQGAFYLFPDVRRHLRKGENATDFCTRLLETAGVAVVSGEAFQAPGHIRISFAAGEREIYRGFKRISEVL